MNFEFKLSDLNSRDYNYEKSNHNYCLFSNFIDLLNLVINFYGTLIDLFSFGILRL